MKKLQIDEYIDVEVREIRGIKEYWFPCEVDRDYGLLYSCYCPSVEGDTDDEDTLKARIMAYRDKVMKDKLRE